MIDFIEKPYIEDTSISNTMMSFIGLQRAIGYLIATCKSFDYGTYNQN